jgi:HEPN domain-containing protein
MTLPYFINVKNFSESKEYLKEAQVALIRAYAIYIASKLFRYNDNHGTVEALQHCFELGIKSMWRLVGLDIPRYHDPTDDLDNVANRLLSVFPHLEDDITWELWKDWVKRKSGQMKIYHNEAIYGDEVKGVPASKLYSDGIIRIMFKEVSFVYTFINQQLDRIASILSILDDIEKKELETRIRLFQELRKDNKFDKDLRKRVEEFLSDKE